MKNPIYRTALENLGKDSHLENEKMYEMIEQFVCELYGVKKFSKVDDARFHIFLQTYDPKDEKFHLKLKSYDACKLPPCKNELKPHI